MSSVRGPAIVRHLVVRPWAVLVVMAALMVAGCSGPGAGKAGGAPPAAPNGTITLTFASANPRPVDTAFATLVDQDSGGHLKLRTVYYNGHSTSIDQTIAADLQKGKLDIGDVGSRAWESLGVSAFRAYQDPFLITSRELLDAAVTGRVAAGLLATLKPAGVTGLAIAPDSVRYLYSTRPLTTLAQFSGAKILINVSATTGEVLRALGATPVTDIAIGPPAIQALRDGTLTAVESKPDSAIANGFVQVAPYVVVNAPLFAKTSTFAVNSARLARLPARDAGWLRQAAQQAAATEATSAADRADWGTLCAQGLKPLALTGQQLTALQNAEAPTYADLASDPPTALAVDRIGGLATSQPRMDAWATCHGAGVAGSATKVLDGSYEFTITQAEVVASGDCTDCGNAGTTMVVIHDGRFAGTGVGAPSPPGNPNQPNVAFFKTWLPGDPSEIGTVSITGNQVTFVPETSQPQGATSTTSTFELFRGLLTMHQLSGQGSESTGPWRKLS